MASGSRAVNRFFKLENCSTDYQRSYKSALKAIQHKSLKIFKDSVESLKKYAGTCPGVENFLDVFYLESVMSLHEKRCTYFYMGLLSYACVNGQKDMVEEMLKPECKASVNFVARRCGMPLTQVLTYALHHNISDKVDEDILQCLIGTEPQLDVKVTCAKFDDDSGFACSPVELAISIKRTDIAGLLVSAGADPIHNCVEVKGVPQLLYEYYEFGTNKYITWLIHQHLTSRQMDDFIERAVKLKIFRNCESGFEMFVKVGRHPAHALLTCGSEDIVTKFLKVHGKGQLTVKDGSGRTALQIATESGDVESVEVLLKFYGDGDDDQSEGSQQNETERTGRQETSSEVVSFERGIHEVDAGESEDTSSSDHSNPLTEDLDSALLVAARNGDIKIMRCILEKIDVFEALARIYGMIRDLAYEEGLATLYEVLEDRIICALFSFADHDGNTIVHDAVLTGNAKLFKVFFPLQPANVGSEARFKALTLKNYVDKKTTPLHLAIENNHICILETLPKYIKERDSHTGAEQNKEKNAWEAFWEEWGPKLFLHACSHGTVDSVKVLLETDKKSNRCVLSSKSTEGETPLTIAAKNGRSGILHFLLDKCQLRDTSTSAQHSPLLLAAENGHAECVSILLKKGFDITQKREDDGFNCLMIATEGKHSDTAMVILSDTKGFGALRCKSKNGSVTPMRMLIEHLPDAAEWVLNRCVLERFSAQDKYEFLEDFTHGIIIRRRDKQQDRKKVYLTEGDQIELDRMNPDDSVDFIEEGANDWRLPKYRSSNHTIKLMAKHSREKLLNHVLVKEWIKHKWWKIGVPLLTFNIGLQILFLFLLTAFAWVLPRPGPSCPMESANTTESFNNSNETCVGLNARQMSYLFSSSVIMIIFCAYYLLLEVFQLFHRGVINYFIDPENPLQNYYQLVTYVSVIIFVSPVGHACWCLPSWKWQIGALAVFLVWINNFVLLKHVPYFGNPVTVLFNIYLKFIKLIYLPILLILTFAFPFYMLFVATEESGDTILFNFITPFHSLWSQFLQMAAGPDTEFFDENLAHPVLTYTLFIVFIIAMPVLFNNFLIGTAIGEIEEERKKAELSLIKLKIDYIFESEGTIPCCGKNRYTIPSKVKVKDDEREKMKKQNEEKIKSVRAAF